MIKGMKVTVKPGVLDNAVMLAGYRHPMPGTVLAVDGESVQVEYGDGQVLNFHADELERIAPCEP